MGNVGNNRVRGGWQTGWSTGVGGEHGYYQFGRYEEGDGLEGEPGGCAGGIGADAVHSCSPVG